MAISILRAALFAASCFVVSNVHAQATATPQAEPAVAEAPKEMLVYDTALAPDWQNWSWAKADLSIELNGSPRKPIRVVAGPWQALYLHHDPFSTAGMSKLSLLIQGSAPDGEVRILALIDGKPVGEGKLLKLSNTGWTQVVVPLVTLGVEDQTINGLWVQNATGTDLPKFYVTEIKIH
ncbi:MAG TPA: hypothetical protein VFS58_07160 [Steroidobacteraceae bacterium]|nr:hypothetical protein [Steroidobacteraceae bacterium]